MFLSLFKEGKIILRMAAQGESRVWMKDERLGTGGRGHRCRSKSSTTHPAVFCACQEVQTVGHHVLMGGQTWRVESHNGESCLLRGLLLDGKAVNKAEQGEDGAAGYNK